MSETTFLKSLTAYNVWANNRIVNFLQQQPETIVNTAVDNSFPSIRKTVYHIWDAQVIWYKRLRGESLTDWPSKQYDDTFEGWQTYFIQQSEEFHFFTENKPDIFFEQHCIYYNLKGEELKETNGNIILHCMNHSTYHRGQIITMLHQMHITHLPSTDFIFYLRDLNKK